MAVADVLASGALEICAEEGEAADRYKLAFRVAEGDFLIRLFKEQQVQVRQHTKRLRKLLGTSGSLSNQELALLDSLDGGGDEEEADPLPGRDLTEHEVHEAHEELREADRKIEELEKKLFKGMRDLDAAGEKLRALTRNTQDAKGVASNPSGKETPMKKAVLEVARQNDQNATLAAETLGQFLMRTPAFFYQLNLIEWFPDSGSEESSSYHNLMRQRANGELHSSLPAMLQDYIDKGQLGVVYEKIDERVREAARQDDRAVCDLLCVLADSKLPSTVHEHLVRVVLELKENVARTDQQFRLDTNFQSAMIATMPGSTPGGSAAPANAKAYDQLSRDIKRLISHNNGRQVTSKLSNAFTKNATDDAPPSSMQKIAAIKGVLEENWKDRMAKDPLLHITAQVTEVLIAIANRGLSELRFFLFNLYGGEDDKTGGDGSQQTHWFERRQAASRICEMASLGNEIALNCVCKHLLKENHWMIRQVAVTEAARIVGRLPEDHWRLRELIDMLVRECFDHPDIDSKLAAPTEVELREMQNVQRATEDALVSQLPTYKHKAQEICWSLLQPAALWFPATGREKLERIRRELSRTAPHIMSNAQSGNQRPADRGGYSSGSRDQTLRKARQAYKARDQILAAAHGDDSRR